VELSELIKSLARKPTLRVDPASRSMLSRIVPAVAAVLLLTSMGSAQTVRFDTNVGNFDVVLNPNDISGLQGHVDNFLAYVEGGFYDNLLINRTPNNFVMQLGRFQIESIFPPSDSTGFIDNIDNRFDPVIVDADGDGTVDFDLSSLEDINGTLNFRGTISLALSGTNSNSGTSEFFVNFVDNGNLDPTDGLGAADFVTFAMVPDMTTIDLINQLTNQNLFGGAFTDVRLLDNGTLVYVERAFILEGAPPELNAANIPEPPTLVLAVGALMLISVLSRHKNF